MSNKIQKVVWTRQAREALNSILDYRYSDIPSARQTVRKDIINASKSIVFAKQFQQDDISPDYRKIPVRDYKLLYTEKNNTAFILNVVCTKAK